MKREVSPLALELRVCAKGMRAKLPLEADLMERAAEVISKTAGWIRVDNEILREHYRAGFTAGREFEMLAAENPFRKRVRNK